MKKIEFNFRSKYYPIGIGCIFKTKSLLVIFAFFLAFSVSEAQNIAKGIVYEDLNNNKIKERNELGISDVCVSNGIQVTKTDRYGNFSLPVGNDNIIFVIKPSEYNFPLDSFNQPLFYYIHKPNGSPNLQYRGVKPTGPLPKLINFGLIKKNYQSNFKILVFGDPQPYNLKEVEYFYQGIVKELENVQDVEFGLSMGDLVGDNLDLFVPYKNAVKKVGIPWYNVIGNHDENYDVVSDTLSDESFEREFGPSNYSFNEGKVHFIILDDILYPDPRDGKGYWGGFREDQFRFIENDLKFVPKDHLVVLAFHIPLSEFEGGDPFSDEHRNRLFSLLKDFPFTLSISAHTHWQSQDFFGEKEGWLQNGKHHHLNIGTSCGDWYSGRLDDNGVPISTMRDGTPKGYGFLNFNENAYTFDYKVAGKEDEYIMEIFAPQVVEKGRWPDPFVYVNFFIGSQNDTLWYRIDDREWKIMDYTFDYDPSYQKKLNEWDYASVLLDGKRPSNPDKCNHLWYGKLPKNLDVGEHVIEIKVKDMFGRIFTRMASYRIETKD
jgi:hypothetical protein